MTAPRATMGTPEMISGSIAGGDKGLETFKIYRRHRPAADGMPTPAT